MTNPQASRVPRVSTMPAIPAALRSPRLPAFALFLGFILLCASLAYWGMQMFRPAARPVAAVPQVRVEAPLEMAVGLFGGRGSGAQVVSNYQLKGIIMAHDVVDSAAVIGIDGRPAQALRVGDEVVPGVQIKEVGQFHVLLVEGGAIKRVELPDYLRTAAGTSALAGISTNVGGDFGTNSAGVPGLGVPPPPPPMPSPTLEVVNPSIPLNPVPAPRQ